MDVTAGPPKALMMMPPNPTVLVPLTTTSVAAGFIESTVLDTVISLPGTKVCVPMTKAEAEFSVYIEFPSVK